MEVGKPQRKLNEIQILASFCALFVGKDYAHNCGTQVKNLTEHSILGIRCNLQAVILMPMTYILLLSKGGYLQERTQLRGPIGAVAIIILCRLKFLQHFP